MSLLNFKNGIELVADEAFASGFDEGRDGAFTAGAMAERVQELERQHSVYSHPAARERPWAAVAALLLGWEASKTIAFLKTQPVEGACDPTTHAARLAVLAKRLDMAVHALEYHEAGMEGRHARRH